MHVMSLRPLLRRAAALLALLSATVIGAAHAVGSGFIPEPDRRDVVHDVARGIVYISTTTGKVQRYDLATQTFLAPFQFGGLLAGMDLSPDGNQLAVADMTSNGSRLFHLVDLNTGQVTQKTYEALFPGYDEFGSYSVAYAADGSLFFTTSYLGSGWLPLRRWMPTTDTIETVATSLSQSAMLKANTDRTVLAWSEGNNSSGPVGTYDTLTNTVMRSTFSQGTGWYNYEIGINHDGTQLAVPTFGGLYAYDEALNRPSAPVYGQYYSGVALGAAYVPGKNIVLLPWVDSTKIRVVNADNWSLLAEFNTGRVFENAYNQAYRIGRIKPPPTNGFMLVTVAGGVMWFKLGPDAQSITAQGPMGSPLSLELAAVNDLPGSTLTFDVITPPVYGSLTGTGASRTYVPNAGHCCADSFTYTATNAVGTSAPATATIVIQMQPPVAESQSFAAVEDTNAQLMLAATNAPQSFEVITGPLSGSLSGTAPNLVYTANANFAGTDSFTFRASNSGGTSQPATVTINVASVNDAPSFTLTRTSVSAKKGSSAKTFTGTAANIAAGPANESSQQVTFVVSNSNPSIFSVQPAMSSTGTLTFKPSKKTGTAIVTVYAQDNGGTALGGIDRSASRTLTISITP